MIPFSQIGFGYASAEVESAQAPALLTDAFLDLHETVRAAIEGRRFLILGVKGSGKSSVGLHLSLAAKSQPELFVTHRLLGDFSFHALGDLIEDEAGADLRYLRGWAWLLLLGLANSVQRDEGVVHEDATRFDSAMGVLREHGLLPLTDLSEAVSRTLVRKIELKAWGVKVAAASDKTGGRVSLPVASDYLRTLLGGIHTSSRHVFVIDGLDDVLLDANYKLEAVSALILEAARLNQYFLEQKCPLKVVVLCRTDIYDRLPGSNQNKLRQDLALELNWFEEAADPASTGLVKLANLRARVSDPSLDDMFKRYLPDRIERRSAVKFLLDHTRHTPRDFLQLLKHIQLSSHAITVDPREIRAGLRSYSEKYLLPEVKDGLEGTLPREDTERLLDCLRQFHKTEFRPSEFEEFLRKARPDCQIDLDRSFRALYRCGAIGNMYEPSAGRRRFSFEYRNPGSVYNRSDSVVIHRGLRRALQVFSADG
ncbi:MAG: hypothetical protein HYY93_05645 [Planctomycetes bacterium]|nr:hypothetical protein [Planctomycetota bacterium]